MHMMPWEGVCRQCPLTDALLQFKQWLHASSTSWYVDSNANGCAVVDTTSRVSSHLCHQAAPQVWGWLP
jgi:hypothetical protein